MVTRRPPESESTERNAPSVEAAFQAAPEEMEGQWLLVHSFAGEERVRAEPFDAIELELALVWSR